MKFHTSSMMVLVGGALLLSAAHAGAAVIVSDTFIAANGTAINGRTPSPTDVPGTTWTQNGSFWSNTIQNDQASLGADMGDAIALNATSTQYTISDSFNISNNTSTNTAYRGAGLGFYTSASSSSTHGFDGFTGLAVNAAGTVSLFINVSGNSPTAATSTTVSGFNDAISHTLSYSINAGTGLISNISLDGNAVSLNAPANTFTAANTALAGFWGNAATSGGTTLIGNFVVSTAAVPEPATLSFLIAAGAIGLLLLKPRRA